MKSKLLLLFVCLTVAVFFTAGSVAVAGEVPHHWHLKVIPKNGQAKTPEANPPIGGAPPAGLYSGGQHFVNTALYDGANSDGTELWPCFGAGSGTPNPDCDALGDPSGPFPGGGAALGTPAYVWTLAADSVDTPLQPYGCNASTTADATNYCGQTNTWYEDWSGDTADELLYIIDGTQNGTTNVLFDSGTVDFGPNPYGDLFAAPGPPADVVIYGDQNFGTYGVGTGPNNGACEADFNYPIPGGNLAQISTITESGTTVTINLVGTYTNTLAVGDYVYITGTTGTNSGNYNGQLAQLTFVSPTALRFVGTAGMGSGPSGGQAILYFDGSNVYYPVIKEAGKTCHNPVASSSIGGALTAQEVKFSATTEIEAAKYTHSTSATACAPNGGPPCWTIIYTAHSPALKVLQSWYIWMR